MEDLDGSLSSVISMLASGDGTGKQRNTWKHGSIEASSFGTQKASTEILLPSGLHMHAMASMHSTLPQPTHSIQGMMKLTYFSHMESTFFIISVMIDGRGIMCQ